MQNLSPSYRVQLQALHCYLETIIVDRAYRSDTNIAQITYHLMLNNTFGMRGNKKYC